MLCNSHVCNCGIVSDSLTVSGSGAAGDPFQIESNAFAVVATTGDLPAGFTGQHAFVIATGRDYRYDGTNWEIISNFPEFQIEAQSAQSIANNSEATATLGTEVTDTDGFHTSTNGFITIPSGMGGRYVLLVQGQFAGSSTGYRYMRPLVANNAGAATQNNGDRLGGYQMEATVTNGFTAVTTHLLAAAATVTCRVFQNSGGALDLNAASLKGFMVRHIPSLV